MNLLRNYNIIKKLNTLVENDKSVYVERYAADSCLTFILQSYKTNGVHVVVEYSFDDIMNQFGKTADVFKPFAGYSVNIYDPQFSILKKRYAPRGELLESNNKLSKTMFDCIKNKYETTTR